MTRGAPTPVGAQSGSLPNPDAKTVEAARYIAELTTELARIAADAQLDLLAHFLSMARFEAETAARRRPPPAKTGTKS